MARELYERCQNAYHRAKTEAGQPPVKPFLPWVKKKRLNEAKDRHEVAAYREVATWILSLPNT
jgi:hypothetical protein